MTVLEPLLLLIPAPWLALLGGLVAGAIVAQPFGPMGQLGAKLITARQPRAAHAVAAVCCLIDALMAAFILASIAWLNPARVAHALGLHPFLLAALGLFLLGLGAYAWRHAKGQARVLPQALSTLKPWQAAALYGAVHPAGLIMFTAIFSVLHVSGVYTQAVLFHKGLSVLGAVIGALGVWSVRLWLIGHLSSRLNTQLLQQVFGRTLAVALILVGLGLLWDSHLWRLLG